MGKRSVKIVLLAQARLVFEKLSKIVAEQQIKGISNSGEMQLLKSIRHKSELLKLNPVYGDQVSSRLIPKDLVVSNLFRVELTHHWRMIYTLSGDRNEVVVFILHILNHPSYDEFFGYRKS